MKTLQIFLFSVVLSAAFASQARDWEKVTIPGAVCGNGEPYSVFVGRAGSTGLVVEFMGGGACWSETTCYGSSPLTKLTPMEGPPPESMITTQGPGNPWTNHTAIFFPYCTGDVFAGHHVAYYKQGVPLYHSGYSNVLATLRYLQARNIVNFAGFNDVTVWGFSAGAIGALMHADTVEGYLSRSARKTLIADSPGLHFGNTFWRKFPDAMNRDFASTFARVGLTYSLDDGLLAPRMGPVFTHYGGWTIGILQSTKDMVMSMIFGNISPEAHRALVLGPRGIGAVAAAYPNVKTWIAETMMHTFLKQSSSASFKDMRGETAWNFVVRVHDPSKERPWLSPLAVDRVQP